MSNSASSFLRTNSLFLLNSSIPGKYDGNPANLPDLFRAVNAELAIEQISSKPPLRPYCMRHLPQGQYLSLDQAADQHEYTDIANFERKLEQFTQKQTIHLNILTKYLTTSVFEDIHAIHDHVTAPVDLKIMLITQHLTEDANSKKPIAIQMVNNDIHNLPHATSVSDAITQLTIADTKYAHLLALGSPRSESDKKRDFLRIVSKHSCFNHLNHELKAARLHEPYDSLKAYLKTLHLGDMTQELNMDGTAPFAKKARLDPNSAQLFAVTTNQAHLVNAFPTQAAPGTTYQAPDGNIWTMMSSTSPSPHSRNPTTNPSPPVHTDCWNCREKTCPGKTNPKLCDKFYCRLCDIKGIVTSTGAQNCLWPNARHPQYHLPHQCVYCPARYKDRKEAPKTTGAPPPKTHPIPYTHLRGPPLRQPQGYQTLLASSQINMLETEPEAPTENQAFDDLMAGSYPDTDSN